METTNSNSYQRLNAARGIGMMGSQLSLCKILKTVVDSMVADLPKIDAALLSEDVPAANRILHAIKGYMPIFACDALVAQVTTLEKISKTEPAAVVLPLYRELAPELQALIVEIRAFLAKN